MLFKRTDNILELVEGLNTRIRLAACTEPNFVPSGRSNRHSLLLKENLECRGLEMSATYFMSDFEIAIKDSFLSFFPDVEAKGCLFHFSKAIISKVARNGFKAN